MVSESLGDEQLVERIRAGEVWLFKVLMRRLNQSLYRVVRTILGQDTDVEDVLQETYISGFRGLGQFDNRAKVSTWFTRIAIRHAYARMRRRAPGQRYDPGAAEWLEEQASTERGPEDHTFAHELADLLEKVVDELPVAYRLVFVMREIDEMDTAEVARCLDLSEEAVRVRLYRARAMMRAMLAAAAPQGDAFPFLNERCAGLVARVSAALQLPPWTEADSALRLG